METAQVKRGRLIDHLGLKVADLAKSRRFYTAVLEVLNVPVIDSSTGFCADELFIDQGDPRTSCHLAFQAPDSETVRRAHAAGLAAGGRDNGGPGLRDYHPNYYAAFLLDPDGNNIEVVFHGPAERSAAAVTITWND